MVIVLIKGCMCSMKIVGEPVKSLNLYKSHVHNVQWNLDITILNYYKDVPGIRVNISMSQQKLLSVHSHNLSKTLKLRQ